MRIQNILFPVDFSPSCVAMAAYVKRAAAIFGARVTLVAIWATEMRASSIHATLAWSLRKRL
jgi:hypothetical protein